MEVVSFKDLFIYILSEIYAVENQIVDELPRIVQKVDSEKLKEALQAHLVETKNQVKRLDRIFKMLNEHPRKIEWAMDIKKLFADAGRFLKDNTSSPLLDAAIIVIAQKIEHFEIATYGSLCEFADVMENKEIRSILKDSLKEEKEADELLTKVAKGGLFSCGVNVEATHNL